MTPFQIILVVAYLSGIGFVLVYGYRLLHRLARPDEVAKTAAVAKRQDPKILARPEGDPLSGSEAATDKQAAFR